MINRSGQISFVIEKPAIARLEIPSEFKQAVEKALSYKDKSFQYSYDKLKKNRWAAQSDPVKWQNDCDNLKAQIHQSLLFRDDDGYYTYSGLYSHLQEYMKMYKCDVELSNQVNYPSEQLLPYELNYKPVKLRYYQDEAVEALLEAKHAAISISTGGGKSLIIQKIIKSLGLKTLVVAPTKSIAGQLLKELTAAFGKKYVGMIGANKRVLDKKITVAIGASLVRIEDLEEIKELQKNEVFIVDESHMWAASTLQKVAIELCENIPYRFFVSATQMRGDGRDLLLESIIGPVVYSKTYRELADEGFLADLDVNFILMRSRSDYNSQNSVRMSQAHFIYNKDVLAYAAQLINEAQEKGEPTLALLDEKEQLHMLSQQLKYKFEVASADTDVAKAVERFNEGSCKLLLGTSAIGMGSDTKPVKHLHVLQYGSSEVAFAQAIGRATRLVEGKTSCRVYIYCVIEGFAAGVAHFKKLRNMIENMDIKTKIHDFRGNN